MASFNKIITIDRPCRGSVHGRGHGIGGHTREGPDHAPVQIHGLDHVPVLSQVIEINTALATIRSDLDRGGGEINHVSVDDMDGPGPDLEDADPVPVPNKRRTRNARNVQDPDGRNVDPVVRRKALQIIRITDLAPFMSTSVAIVVKTPG